MTGGAFTDAVRAAVLQRDPACVGCRRASPLTLQHRRARGMGGRSGGAAAAVASPANALVLCGSGTTGDHGWAEHHPEEAERLGWRIAAHDPRPAQKVPAFGWWMGQLLWRYFDPSPKAMWRFPTDEEYAALPSVEEARLWLPLRRRH